MTFKLDWKKWNNERPAVGPSDSSLCVYINDGTVIVKAWFSGEVFWLVSNANGMGAPYSPAESLDLSWCIAPDFDEVNFNIEQPTFDSGEVYLARTVAQYPLIMDAGRWDKHKDEQSDYSGFALISPEWRTTCQLEK